jgi:hypothetical protein
MTINGGQDPQNGGGAAMPSVESNDVRQVRQTVNELIAKLRRVNDAKEARRLSAQLVEAVSKLPK